MKLNTTSFYNRDLSWLRFNHRVLQEANDAQNPLYERIKFLAIFSSNLDEFFKVRVSAIRQIKQLNKPLRKKLLTRPNKLLKAIKKEVDAQQIAFGRIFNEELIPALAAHKIYLINYREFTPEQRQFAADYYMRELHDVLQVIQSESGMGTTFLKNEALYLVGQTAHGYLKFIELPATQKRFVQLPKNEGYAITFVDDIIKAHGIETEQMEFYALKISRDAELYIENEYSGNLLNKIKASLPKRQSGQITRALVDEHMPEPMVQAVKTVLEINNTDLVLGSTYHNFKDFFSFPNPTNHRLNAAPFIPQEHPAFQNNTAIFTTVSKADRLLQFPYHSFNTVLQWLEEAVHDPAVRCIKISFYRISKTSKMASLLVKAATKGIDVLVFIETKARFDEENNIQWGERLEKAGARVLYSYPGIKIHAKILYFERREQDKIRRYGYISTGNFNEKTATLYADYALMTAEPKITKELGKVFKVIDGSLIIPKTKKLVVSPFNLRQTLVKYIKREIQNATQGKPAYIQLKLNSLQDQQLIEHLYDASRAGVNITLNIRGICCLVPGVPGQSERITVISIVDRFLEHGRIYLFANGGQERMFIGSADWMTRNLDHRIEVVVPIEDPAVFSQLKHAMELQFADNVKARQIDQAQQNNFVRNDRPPLRSQYALAEWIKKEGETRQP